jgi:hypothetical protein
MKRGLQVLTVLSMADCPSVSPARLTRGPFDYIVAMAELWQSQRLLHVVKLSCR